MTLSDIMLNYFFIAVFLFLIALIFLFIAIIIKTKTIKKICIAIFSIFIAIFILEIINSFYLLSTVDTFDNEISYFPSPNDNITKSTEILLDDGDIGRFSIDEHYDYDRKEFVKNKNIVYEVIYTIDKNGLRYTESNDNSKEAYLFLGCSFIFGEHINDDETLPYLVSKNLNFEKKVINAGLSGYGINKACSMLLTKDFLDNLLEKAKLKYIFYEFIEDHISRAFRYIMPSDVLLYENGKEYEVKQPFRIIKKYGKNSLIYDRLFYKIIEKNFYPFYTKYINNTFLKMYNISKDYYDANFVVIMWNSNKDLEKYFVDNNIDFIKAYEVLDYENDTVKEDGHPNINGNKKIADLIIKYIKSKEQI